MSSSIAEVAEPVGMPPAAPGQDPVTALEDRLTLRLPDGTSMSR